MHDDFGIVNLWAPPFPAPAIGEREMNKHEAADLLGRVTREISDLRAMLAMIYAADVAAGVVIGRALERVRRDLTAANESLREALDYLDYGGPL